ncbi:hypothetical protein T484DRAFT_1981693 [Baffinella frigidus]|nr:hypothetical protein T484DRAFT_1981693 [Cryptophyta sp. CCMP2293]
MKSLSLAREGQREIGRSRERDMQRDKERQIDQQTDLHRAREDGIVRATMRTTESAPSYPPEAIKRGT